MWIIFAIAVIVTSYLLLVRPHKYWSRNGVVQGKPVFIFGDLWGPILKLQPLSDAVQMMYNIDPKERYIGIYQALLPSLLIRDPDLIKQMTVKDFDHFVDHRSFVPEDSDPFFAKNLFALNGQKWRDMRSTLSPAFTSSKIKHMFLLTLQNGNQFVNNFLNQNKDLITVETKDIFTRFTNDVIANTVFGLEVDSLEQPKNEFYLMGQEATDFTGIKKHMKFFGYILMPRVLKFFKIPLLSKEVCDFFDKLVKDNISSRKKHGIVRPDMINLLMEAQKHGLKYEESHDVPDTGFATVQESDIGKYHKAQRTAITDQDITAQAMVFLSAGFDSVAALMSFMSYELGLDQDVQEKLRQEIDETLENCNGKLTYEALMNMKYLDMVVSETLRKWPVTPAMERKCTKAYTIQPNNPTEKPVHLREGDTIILPIYGLHRDPQHFPDPDRFDPERFSDDNKKNIKPYTYIPFSSGPRNCIGSRFALLETKILFVCLLSYFEIVPVEKTQIPLKLSKKMFTITAESGCWLGLKRRIK